MLEQVAGGARGMLLGAGATAAWVDLGGFVLAVTTREAPLLPNAVALTAGAGALAKCRLAASRAGRREQEGLVGVAAQEVAGHGATSASRGSYQDLLEGGPVGAGAAGRLGKDPVAAGRSEGVDLQVGLLVGGGDARVAEQVAHAWGRSQNL